MADTKQIQHLLNNLNLGTSQTGAGDYIIGTLTASAAVTPLANPSTATTTQIATALNALITALGNKA